VGDESPIMQSGGEGIRDNAKNAGQTNKSKERDLFCNLNQQIDPDLAAVVDAWPKLTSATKAQIVALIRGDE
jgi:hypothetical protein